MSLTPGELDRRFDHHPPKDAITVRAHESIRAQCKELAVWIGDLVPDGVEKSIAIQKLEEVMMWANAGIARQ